MAQRRKSRRLNKRQQRRIQANHRRRATVRVSANRSSTPPALLDGQMPGMQDSTAEQGSHIDSTGADPSTPGRDGPVPESDHHEGLVLAHYGLNVAVEDASGTVRRCAVREALPEQPVCGDRVIWQAVTPGPVVHPGESGASESVGEGKAGQGVVVAIKTRRTLLKRPAPQRMGTKAPRITQQGLQKNRLVKHLAANVDRLVIVTSADRPRLGLIDRYLLAASVAGISALIVFNKGDLIEDHTPLEVLLAPYRTMGHVALIMSATTGEGIEVLGHELMAGGVHVFAGPSGVGKSSLLRHWIHDDSLAVGAIHEASGQGRHTTTVARLYRLPGGRPLSLEGVVIDSPGIRQFGLYEISREMVGRHFHDIAPYIGQCRFSNCTHSHEPKCAVQDAVSQGHISPRRLASMQAIIDSLPASHFES